MEGHEGLAGLLPTLTSARLLPDRGHRPHHDPMPVSLNRATPIYPRCQVFLCELLSFASWFPIPEEFLDVLLPRQESVVLSLVRFGRVLNYLPQVHDSRPFPLYTNSAPAQQGLTILGLPITELHELLRTRVVGL